MTGVLALGTALVSPATAASASTKSAELSHVGGSVTVWAEWTSTEQQDFEAALTPFETTPASPSTTAARAATWTRRSTPPSPAARPRRGPGPRPRRAERPGGEGKLQPLSGVLGSLASNYAAAWNTLATHNGTLYGVWFKGANKNTIWYNPAEFAAAGIKSTPTTWEQLITRRRDSAGSRGHALLALLRHRLAGRRLLAERVPEDRGGGRLRQAGRPQHPVDDPTVTTAFNTIGQLVGKPSFLLGGTSGALREVPGLRRQGVPQAGNDAPGGDGDRGRLRRLGDHRQLHQLHAGTTAPAARRAPPTRRSPLLRLLPLPGAGGRQTNTRHPGFG